MEFPLSADHIFIAGGYTDMRHSFDALSDNCIARTFSTPIPIISHSFLW